MAGLWSFLASAENREILAWIGGGLAIAASGLWVVIRHVTDGPAASKSARAAQPTPRPLTAGRDIHIGDVALPRLAIGLAALGMLLLGLAALLGPGDSATGSVTAGGDIRDSTISITDSPASATDH